MRGSQNLNRSLVFSMEPVFSKDPWLPLQPTRGICQHHLLVASGDCKLLLHEQGKVGGQENWWFATLEMGVL